MPCVEVSLKGGHTPNLPTPVLMVTEMEPGTFFTVVWVSPYCGSAVGMSPREPGR